MRLSAIGILTFLLALSVDAQDTLRRNKNQRLAKPGEDVETYSIVYHSLDSSRGAMVKTYSADWKLVYETSYSDYEKLIADGISKTWYPDGQLKREINYKKGLLHGCFESWYPDGTLKRKDKYSNGEVMNGQCFGRDGSDTTWYKYEIWPEYPGGERAFHKFLESNIKYPDKARNKHKSGTVYLQFCVETDGTISDIVILKGICESLDKEALRLASKIEQWKPGFIDGVPIRLIMNMPIKFTLSD
ncbi:MAG: TonB family protein [Bacteroidales bacterium]|nr:TonB family protein [Bacteroidales bacterium]